MKLPVATSILTLLMTMTLPTGAEPPLEPPLEPPTEFRFPPKVMRPPPYRVKARRGRPRPGVRSWIRKQPASKPRVGLPRSVGWGEQESMTYSVKLAGVEAARAAISVGSPTSSKGRRLLTLRGLAETVTFISTFVKMREEVITQVDLAGLLPLHSTADRQTGKRGKDRWMRTRFGDPIHQLIRRKGRDLNRHRRIQAPLFDPISGLFAARSMPLTRARRLRLLILNGNSLYEVTVKVGGRERIYTRLGPRDAIRLDGVGRRVHDDGHRPIPGKQARRLSLWLSDDQARVPLKLRGDTDLGSIEASITSYQPPRSRLQVQVAQERTRRAASPGVRGAERPLRARRAASPGVRGERVVQRPRQAFGTRR